MEYSSWIGARKRGNLNRVDLSFDFARSSHVRSRHSFDVIKAHLECVVIKTTDKQRLMTRDNLIHDVLWATGTHEMCRIDEGALCSESAMRVAALPHPARSSRMS